MFLPLIFSLSLVLADKGLISSNPRVVAGHVTEEAINQSFTIQVARLATNELWVFEHTGLDVPINTEAGEFVIWVRGKTHRINVPTNTSLRDLAKILNQAQPGFTAMAFDTCNGSNHPARLMLQDNTTGRFGPDQWGNEPNLVFVDRLKDLHPVADFQLRDGDESTQGINPYVEGMDSKIYLNGVTTDPIYRDGNSIDDLILGVRLLLRSASADATDWTTVSIIGDDSINRRDP